MLTPFLLIGGWVFWTVLAVVIAIEIALLWSDADETPMPILIALIAFACAVMFTDAFRGVNIFWLLPLGALYALIGVVWAVKKWWTFVTDKRADLRRKYDAGSVNKSAKGNETFESYAADSRPSATENKQRIVTWMVLWPFSATWWVLTWPRRFFSWLYDQISTTFDRITDRIWKAS